MAWPADSLLSSTERSFFDNLNSTIQRADSWMQTEGKEPKMGDRDKVEMRGFVEMLYKRVKQKLENEREQKDKTDRITTNCRQRTFVFDRKSSKREHLVLPTIKEQKKAPNSKIKKSHPILPCLTPARPIGKMPNLTPAYTPRDNKASIMRRAKSQGPTPGVSMKKRSVGQISKNFTPVQLNKSAAKRIFKNF